MTLVATVRTAWVAIRLNRRSAPAQELSIDARWVEKAGILVAMLTVAAIGFGAWETLAHCESPLRSCWVIDGAQLMLLLGFGFTVGAALYFAGMILDRAVGRTLRTERK